MFQNFNMIDFIILGSSVLLNIVFLIIMIVLVLKSRKTVLDKIECDEEIKVTKVNSVEDNTAFDEIIEAMQKDLDSKSEDAVELFEQEQEEKAIISYQELLNSKNKNEESFEKIEKLGIPVEEDIEVIEEIPLEKTKATPVLATTEKKFTNSEFVSPVFGKMDRNVNFKVEAEEDYDNFDLEKTLNIEPLTEEIKKNNEFLNALKEFRKNL